MEWESFTTDQLEQLLAADEGRVSQLRARQLLVLEELDRRQVATADGCKSLSEWLAARLDLSLDTASSLVQTMRRTGSRDDLLESLADDEISFDRMAALSRITEDVGFLCWFHHHVIIHQRGFPSTDIPTTGGSDSATQTTPPGPRPSRLDQCARTRRSTVLGRYSNRRASANGTSKVGSCHNGLTNDILSILLGMIGRMSRS